MNDRNTRKPLPADKVPSIDTLAKAIVMDGVTTQRRWPQNLVESDLPIPIAKGSRKRVSRKFKVAMDPTFHSAYDKAIHLIQTEHESTS